jgi:D-lyxose ketol-isomerase
MLLEREVQEARAACVPLMKKAGVVLSDSELALMEVADFGLGDYRAEGSQIATLVSTSRVGMKVICLQPGQTLPEHWHSAMEGYEGKEETLRVLYGTLRLYLPGGDGPVEGFIPKGKQSCYTCRKEVCLTPVQQITLKPGVKHWLQAGEEGTVLFSISSMATCTMDPFTDPDITRMPVIIKEEV